MMAILKHDVEEHPPLSMNGVLIKESKVLSILGFHFDSRLTWDYMIDSTVRRCRPYQNLCQIPFML